MQNQENSRKFTFNTAANTANSRMNSNRVGGGGGAMPPPPAPPPRPPVPQPVWSNNNNTNKNQRAAMTTTEIVVIGDSNDDDDDLLDISDNELIRASQQVESSLRFTNNVHHTTSNALNIFSQYTVDADLTTATASQLPPSTLYSNSNLMDHDEVSKLRSDFNKLKGDKMNKDAEVKILRDNLKRAELENAKIRAEKADLNKRLQQKSDEAQREYKKLVEFKQLQDQMKDQEIVDLTMRYKVLEATVRKNPNSTVMLVNQHQQHHSMNHHSPPPPQATNLTPPSQVLLTNLHGQIKTSSMPMKRTAPAACPTDENEQPETKRPTLVNVNNNTSHRGGIQHQQQILQTKSSNTFKTTRSSDHLTSSMNKPSPISPSLDASAHRPTLLPQTPQQQVPDLKRQGLVKTKLDTYYSSSSQSSSSNSSLYLVTDHLTDLSNFVSTRYTVRGGTPLHKYEPLGTRMTQFVKFMQTRRVSNGHTKSAQSTLWSTRIETVVVTLNTELTRLLLSHFLLNDENLFVSLIHSMIENTNNNNQSILSRQFRSITDLVCSVYTSLFEVFLFRIENSTNREPRYLQSVCRDMFTSVMSNWLHFIDYTRLAATPPHHQQRPVDNNTMNKNNETVYSTWCLSYLTLNMLSVFVDSVNVLSSRMTLYQVEHAPPLVQDSQEQQVANIYLAILDSMHSIQSQSYLLFHIKDGESMSEDVCLYHTMCQKMQKYFNELAYTFDSLCSKCCSSSSSSYCSSESRVNTATSTSSVEIITTIGNDLSASDSKVDFKLAKHQQKSSTSSLLEDQHDSSTTSTYLLPNSKSQTDLQFDFLQSQVPPSASGSTATTSTSTHKSESSSKVADAELMSSVSSIKPAAAVVAIDVSHVEQIRALQYGLVSKFFHFMTQNRVTECVENRLLASSSSHSYKSLLTNRIRCKCHIDLLQTILPVIDYQYNEKLINDPSTQIGFVEYFNSRNATSNSTTSNSYLLNWPVKTSNQQLSKQQQSKDVSPMSSSNTLGGVNFVYMKMLNCMSSVWSFINPTTTTAVNAGSGGDAAGTEQDSKQTTRDELAEQRVKLNESLLKYDYRMRHFLSLYKLADMSFQDATTTTTSQQQQIESTTTTTTSQETSSYSHLKSSLNSITTLFRSFLDDYFDFS